MKSIPRKPATKVVAGFTLIEMLIVLGIIGVLSVGALSVFNRETSRGRVQSVRAQLIADLQEARSKTQRYNCGWTVRFVSSTQYMLIGPTLGGAALTCVQPYPTTITPVGTPPAGVSVTTRDLPVGIRIRIRTVATGNGTEMPTGAGFEREIPYFPPFATVPGATNGLEVGITADAAAATTNALFVKIVGLTGKVIPTATF